MIKINATGLARHEQRIVDTNNWAFDQTKKISSLDVQENDGYLSHLSNCVVSVVPVQSDEAVFLFGQKNRTLTFNRVNISEALVNKNDSSDIKKGRTLVEYYVTDQDLSLALINQGGNASTITMSNIEGFELDLEDIRPIINSVNLGDDDLKGGIQKQGQLIKTTLAGINAELDKAKPSKKNVKPLTRTLKSAIYNLVSNAEYSTKTLSENLTVDVNNLDFEIKTTINRLSHYQSSLTVNLLENKEADYIPDSYLKWVIEGRFNELDKQSFYSLLERLNEKRPNEKLQSMIKDYKDNNKFKRRELRDATDCVLSFNTVMGRGQLAHESNSSDKTVEMRLSTASVAIDHKVRIHSNNEFLRIAFSPNDLLMLIRSDKDSFILGTMTRYANESVELVKLQTYIEEKINAEANFSGINNNLYGLAEAIEVILEAPMKKAEKLKAREIIVAITEELTNVMKETEDVGSKVQEEIIDIFKNKLQQKVSVSMKSLPDSYSKKIVKMLGHN